MANQLYAMSWAQQFKDDEQTIAQFLVLPLYASKKHLSTLLHKVYQTPSYIYQHWWRHHCILKVTIPNKYVKKIVFYKSTYTQYISGFHGNQSLVLNTNNITNTRIGICGNLQSNYTSNLYRVINNCVASFNTVYLHKVDGSRWKVTRIDKKVGILLQEWKHSVAHATSRF